MPLEGFLFRFILSKDIKFWCEITAMFSVLLTWHKCDYYYSDTFVLLLLMMLLSDAHTNPIIFLRICKTWTLPRVIKKQKKEPFIWNSGNREKWCFLKLHCVWNHPKRTHSQWLGIHMGATHAVIISLLLSFCACSALRLGFTHLLCYNHSISVAFKCIVIK